MRAVHLHLADLDDPAQVCAIDDPHPVPGLIARVRLLVGERVRDLVRNVLDQRAAEHDVQELLAAADAEHRKVAIERPPRDRPFEGGARVFRRDRRVPVGRPEQRRIDVEGAARDDQAIDQRQVLLHPVRLVRQQHRRAARLADAAAIVLAQGEPRKLRVPARLLAIQGNSDDRRGHARDSMAVPPGAQRPASHGAGSHKLHGQWPVSGSFTF
jgi:hypothetical protein